MLYFSKHTSLEILKRIQAYSSDLKYSSGKFSSDI